MSTRQKGAEEVYVMSQKAKMRFTPIHKYLKKEEKKIQQNEQKNRSKLWSIWPFSFNKKIEAPHAKLLQLQNEQTSSKKIEETEDKSDISKSKLKWACKLSNEHILVGNEYQLDLINIANISSNNFIDVEYLWSIRHPHKIMHVNSEERKMNMFTIVTEARFYIYRYDQKRIPNEPIPFVKQIILEHQPLFVQIAKDGSICLFYQSYLQIYIVAEEVRRKYKSTYSFPQKITENGSKFKIVTVPRPFQNLISLFFQQIKDNISEEILILWCIEYEFAAAQVRCHPIQKIYQNKKVSKMRSTINISNYSKEVFLLNIGSQILALKKGYILDSANVNPKKDEAMLEYIGNNVMLHINLNSKKIQIYDFSINLFTKPYRISIKPKDSIKVSDHNHSCEYFKVLQMLGNDYVFIMQDKKQFIKQKRGELHYYLHITRSMSKQQKMKELFPNTLTQFKIDDPILIDKCDMAEKMGYSLKEIYLHLWHRTASLGKQDYSLLIATKNYHTIKEEIARKLKKQSMAYKSIYNIEQACFAMLSQKVFSTSCTQEVLMDYISSHFFKRKLEMFKDLHLIQKAQRENETNEQINQTIKITIRQYQELKAMEIKAQLIFYINQFCHENMSHLSVNIRLLLRNFRFVFRIIYESLLEEIIINAKDKLLELLIQFPQLLPYSPAEEDRPLYIPPGFKQGVWSEITNQEWTQNLHIDAITTIDNIQIAQEQLIKSINFKRLWLSQHDMVTKSKQAIKENYEHIKSSHIFYFFIAKIFNYVQDRSVLKSLIQFIQTTYSPEKVTNPMYRSFIQAKLADSSKQTLIVAMPDNIIGLIFLYERIFKFLSQQDQLPKKNGNFVSFCEFLEYKDYELVKHFFEKQRSIKGILLGDIKNIYKQILPNHNQVFNKALLNYFISDLSQISDLKYMLNRINSQKHSFHRQNEDMYTVLIQSLERKLKIGTKNDIPIQQVLIYLQNIPINSKGIKNSQADLKLYELKSIEDINKNSDYLRKCKINMSIYDILRNHEQVFIKLLEFQVNNANDNVWKSQQQFVKFAIQALSRLEYFSQHIYRDPKNYQPMNYKILIIFIFLTKICQKTQRIKFARHLLSLNEIKKRYKQFPTDGLVQFMHKWALCKNANFLSNQKYINELLTLISADTRTAQYISSQLEFAKTFSHINYHILYPISSTTLCFRDLKTIVQSLPIDFVLQVPIQKVYQIVHKMQQIILQQAQEIHDEESENSKLSGSNNIITLHEVYEIFIVKFINGEKLKQAIPLVKTIFQLEIIDKTYNIIYPILFIKRIEIELNQLNKQNLVQCIWYYFFQPKQLLKIIEQILTVALSPEQLKKLIEQSLENGKKKFKGFNTNNMVLSPQYLSVVEKHPDNSKIFIDILFKTGKHIQQSKQDFKHIRFALMMVMICNDPFVIAKFISCIGQRIIKSVRSFLSYAILQDIFQPFNLLEMGRRIFLVLLYSDSKQLPIQSVITEFNQMDLDDDAEIYQYTPPLETDTFESVLWKSSEAFRKKKNMLKTQFQSGKKSRQLQNKEQKKNRIQKIFQGIQQKQKKQPSDYLFQDSDNQDTEEVAQLKQTAIGLRKSKMDVVFEAKTQRNAILESVRLKKPSTLYKSIQNVELGQRSNNKLFVSTRNFNLKSTNLKINKSQKQTRNKNSYKLQQGQLDKAPNLRVTVSHNQFQKYNKSDFIDNKNKQVSAKRNALNNNIQPPMMRIDSQENESLQNISDKLKISYKNTLKIEDIHSDQSSNFIEIDDNTASMVSNNYKIHVNEVEEDLGVSLLNSTHFKISYEQTATKLLNLNHNILFKSSQNFNIDLSPLKGYDEQKVGLQQIIKEIYRQSSKQSSLHGSLILIKHIIKKYQVLGIDVELFNLIIKAQQVHSKTLSDIKFVDLVSEESIVKQYQSDQQIFNDFYKNLKHVLDSENIFSISTFVRRIFDNPLYEQEVLWDFVMQLCQKIDNLSEDQRIWNLEKISANLPQINVKIWNNKFDIFRKKVFESNSYDELISVFCQDLKKKENKQQSRKFLLQVQAIYDSQKINETLEYITNN